jgi:hypothetical protein
MDLNDPDLELSRELASLPLELDLMEMTFTCGVCRSPNIRIENRDAPQITPHSVGHAECKNSGRSLGQGEIKWVRRTRNLQNLPESSGKEKINRVRPRILKDGTQILTEIDAQEKVEKRKRGGDAPRHERG